ncbi:MAG: hypothetical protein IPJ01_10775 [Micavibrio sp.]|nr:hypothetical protein [Micavibrio sp.]
MITKKEYLKAKSIVTKYEEMVNKIHLTVSPNFKKGQLVKTTKGCRFKGGFVGTVVGLCTWGEYLAVKVRKRTDKRIVVCLAKNLVKWND